MALDDYEWFVSEFAHLYDMYGACYLAICNRRVVGKFDSFERAVQQMDTILEPGSYIVQRVCKNIEDTYVHITTPLFLLNHTVEE